MKKLILMLLLCIPNLIYAQDLGELLTKGTYTVTFTGETYPLTSTHILPNNVQSSIVIELPPLPDNDAYYEFVLVNVSDNAPISWSVEPKPQGRKCYFCIDGKKRSIIIQILIRTGNSYQEIIDGRMFRFEIY